MHVLVKIINLGEIFYKTLLHERGGRHKNIVFHTTDW